MKRQRITTWLLAMLLLGFLGACSHGDSPSEQAAAPSVEHKARAKGEEGSLGDHAAPAATAAAKSKAPGGGKTGVKPLTTWKRSQALPHSSKLMVGERESLALRGMQLKAKVDGFRARIVIDYYYANTSSRSYEGTFKMRLPNGASPYFFAFGETGVSATAADQGTPKLPDFTQARSMGVAPDRLMKERESDWKQPKEARMVPRAKAARAYGDTVRRSVDPALLEWSGAGVFSARVFPLSAGKVHRIVVGYDVDLLAVGGELVLDAALPEDVPFLTADFDVAMPSGSQIRFSDGAETMDLQGRRYAHYNKPKHSELRVSVKHARDWMLVGKDSHVGEHFAAAFTPVLPKSATTQRARNAVLLLDTSLSSNPDKFNVWLKLTEALLTENRNSMKRFAVMFFNVEARWWKPQFVDNNEENVQALLQDANALVLEGATDLGSALGEAGRFVAQTESGADVFLLSDGAATWGENNLYALSRSLRGTPLFAYRSGMAGSDNQALTHLTRETGGAVFSVVGEAEVKSAARAHRKRPWTLVKAELDGASELMLAGRPNVLFDGQRLVIVGRGAPEGPLRLTVKQGKREKVLQTKFAQLTSPLTPRSYGAVAVQQLEALEAAAEGLATAYASHYRVTGKSCSLLMLESEADYRARGVVPKDHAQLVKARAAGPAVRAALDAIEASLGDPKVGFFNWLETLSHTPGADVKLNAAFSAPLQQLPAHRFALPTKPLVVKQHNRGGIPEAYLQRLAKRNIDYDVFTAEAGRRLKEHGAADGLKAISSLVENSPGDTVLARDVAGYASQHGLADHAYHLLRRVADARPHEPQTYLGLARTAARSDRPELAMAFYEIALSGAWDERFGDFKTIVELQYTRLLRRLVKKGELPEELASYAKQRLAKPDPALSIGEADMLVVIMWNTDNTDIDLHVIEPSGEDCFYGNRTTKSGGQMTKDVTRGYGPEMYTLRKAPQGSYKVRAKYFASDANRASARTKVEALVFRDWGRPNESMSEQVVTLEYGKEMHDITTIKR